jgi:hypothetical protein
VYFGIGACGQPREEGTHDAPTRAEDPRNERAMFRQAGRASAPLLSQGTLHALLTLTRNAVFNGPVTARSRAQSMQHGSPSHALPRNGLRSLYDHHTHISRTPYGWVRTALQTPVQRHASTAPGIRPAQAFGLVASGLALGHDGTHAAYGVLATDYGGARHVPPLEALAQGGSAARLRSSVPPVSRFKRLSRPRRQEMCGQMRHTLLADRRAIQIAPP